MKKKLIKLLLLTIVLLLQNFICWCQSNYHVKEYDTTITVEVPIEIIRQATIKLIDREQLIEQNYLKDSILILQKNYIDIQKKTINDFQSKLVKANDINADINKRLERDKYIISFTGGALGAAIITTVIVCCIKK